MDDEGFAGITGEQTHLGILTHTDSEYNYVWAPYLKTLELRYPLNPQLAFQPGDTVRFKRQKPGDAVRFLQQKDGRGPQIVHDLVKEKDYKLEVVREKTKNGTIAWKVKVNMVFAPETNERLRKMKEIDEKVQGLAFTDNFMEVLCFLKLDVVPGMVYEGYVTRLPEPFIVLGKKMGSLFCVKHRQGTPFNTIVTDSKAIEELIEHCPFADEITSNESDDIGLPSNRAHHSSSTIWAPVTQSNADQNSVRSDQNSIRSQPVQKVQDHFPSKEVDASNYAARLEDLEEGTPFLGLVVRVTDEYAVIWSPTHDLVRIQLPTGAELQQQQQQYNIATWVHYRCFDEQSQLLRGVRCSYTAYYVALASRDDRVVSTCSTDYGTEVVMQCFLTNPTEHNPQLFQAIDSFVGRVICPHDRWLKEQVQKEQCVQVMSIFTDEYKCRWMAFAMEKQNDVYQKLDELPAVIDAKVQPFFNRTGGRRMQQADEQMHLVNVGARFQPPLDWKGPRECGNTVVNVLGVTIGNEQDEKVSVIATSYGIARQPKRLELGTWVEATIQVESDEQAVRTLAYDSFMHEHTYRVLYSKKISPPMSTRVVNKSGAEKLLLCGDVKCVVNCLRNDYLGRVEDTKQHIRTKPGESYLVEIGINRQPENRRNCFWNVLKSHGKSVKSVHKVPFQLSVYPIEEGKTCDDAHRILIDQVFDARDNTWDTMRPIPAYESATGRSLAVQQREEMREDLHRRNCNNNPIAPKPTALVHRSSRSSSSSSLDAMTSAARENHRIKQQQQQWVEYPAGANNSRAGGPPMVAHLQHHAQLKPNPFDDTLDAFAVNRKAVGATPAPATAAPVKKINTTNTTKYVDAGESDDVVLAELLRYEPSTAHKKIQANGLVVRKRPEYLLMYNPKYGLSILLPKYANVQSACEFDEKFSLGEFYSCAFIHVAEREARRLTYEWMCKGDFKLHEPMLKTRLIMDRFVHVHVNCEFTKEKITKLHGDHYVLKTDLGNVRFGKEFLTHNDLYGKSANVWVAFVKETEGCHWEIVQDSWGSLLDDEPPPQMLTTSQPEHSVVAQQQNLQNQLVEQLRSKLHCQAGYVDFLFGSEVCDGLGGERTAAQRYGMANDSDGDGESDSDDFRQVDNWDDSASTTDDGIDADLNNDSEYDSDAEEKRMRIIGGASPPRPRHFQGSFPNHGVDTGTQRRLNGVRPDLLRFE
ncbi:hypothetical protein niasHS_014199 [Heterodera schachtii]|uniref:Uncharacterized protein n=1 Tax=Heterodera schachtii TaxID=97005 RepID=A0ABD2I3S3_HETSC